jgi:hypothetical protein
MAGEASGGRPVDGQRRDAAPGDPRTRPYAATLKPRGPYPFSGPAATATRTNCAVLVRYAPLSKNLLKIRVCLAQFVGRSFNFIGTVLHCAVALFIEAAQGGFIYSQREEVRSR